MILDKVTGIFIPIREDGKILIQDRRKKPGTKMDYGFFGGKLKENETHQSACIREVFEELGYRYNENEISFVGQVIINSTNSNGQDFLYTKKITNKEVEKYECHEGEIMWVTAAQAVAKLEHPMHKIIPFIIESFHQNLD